MLTSSLEFIGKLYILFYNSNYNYFIIITRYVCIKSVFNDILYVKQFLNGFFFIYFEKYEFI